MGSDLSGTIERVRSAARTRRTERNRPLSLRDDDVFSGIAGGATDSVSASAGFANWASMI